MGAGATSYTSAFLKDASTDELTEYAKVLPQEVRGKLTNALTDNIPANLNIFDGLESENAAEEDGALQQPSSSVDFQYLEGDWLAPPSRLFSITCIDGVFYYSGIQGVTDGEWHIFHCTHTSFRFKPTNPKGRAVVIQSKARHAVDWCDSAYSFKRDAIGEGVHMITRQQAPALVDRKAVGRIPTDTLIVAAGAVKTRHTTGRWAVPIQPFGEIELQAVRLFDGRSNMSMSDISALSTGKPSEKYNSLRSLADALNGNHTVLVRGTWIQSVGTAADSLPRRQEFVCEVQS